MWAGRSCSQDLGRHGLLRFFFFFFFFFFFIIFFLSNFRIIFYMFYVCKKCACFVLYSTSVRFDLVPEKPLR